jgi:hypothetical protein
MDAAVAAGFTVMRAWSHGVTPNYALQTAPGVYNEAMFRGLDYALDEAQQRNIKVAFRMPHTTPYSDMSCLMGLCLRRWPCPLCSWMRYYSHPAMHRHAASIWE